MILTWPSAVVMAVIGTLKWQISIPLSSGALREDAICSLAVACLSTSVGISVMIYRNDSSVWWFDAFIALATALFLGAYGVMMLKQAPWWTKHFWVELESESGARALDAALDDAFEVLEEDYPVEMEMGAKADKDETAV